MKSNSTACMSVFRFIFFFTVFSLVSWSYGVSTSHAAKTYKFSMQNMFSLNHPITKAIQEMAKEVNEKSKGRIVIQVLPSGALVKGPNVLETVSNGGIDMGSTCSCYHSGILPFGATAFALPGDPRDKDEILEFIYREDVLKFFRDAYASVNVFFGAPMVMDGYTIVSKKPIQTWEDLKTIKVRASGTIAKTLQKLGIPTVFIPFSEIYVALSRGTIDAEISGNHAESFLAKTFEVAKYQTDPAISGAQNCEIIVNLDRWQALPEDLKTIFDAALKKCAQQVTELFDEENRKLKKQMTAAGAQFIDLPQDVMERWTKTATALWDEELAKDPLSAEYIKMVKKELQP